MEWVVAIKIIGGCLKKNQNHLYKILCLCDVGEFKKRGDWGVILARARFWHRRGPWVSIRDRLVSISHGTGVFWPRVD